jgi:ribonuclease HI
MSESKFTIFTDGSCHTQYKIGAWAAVIFHNENRNQLSGICTNTTHNRMELLAVIESLDYLKGHFEKIGIIEIITDSQYVADIHKREEKLITNQFKTKSGKTIQNDDLVKRLIHHISQNNIEFIKIKAHQKEGINTNYNRQVDKLVRKNLRLKVKQLLNDNQIAE